MKLRRYESKDLPEIADLFRETILTVNCRDYSQEQVEVWAKRWQNLLRRDEWFLRLFTLVAEQDGKIIGYGNIDESGYLDHLYVHRNYQRQGVATALCEALEVHTDCNVTVDASITAKPFFEQRGYKLLKENSVELEGIFLTNFTMVKEREQ